MSAAALVAAPVAAQAAPMRAPAPLAAEDEELAGMAGGLLWPIVIAVALALGIYLLVDGDDDAVSP